jgi:hypothetical protein
MLAHHRRRREIAMMECELRTGFAARIMGEAG